MVVTKKTLANLAKLFLNQAKFKKSFQISKYKEAEKMKLTFKHTALSLALAGSFALTGCNFIGDGDAVFTDPVAEQVAFDGSAIKGVLRYAPVSAYLLTDTDQTNNLLAGQGIETDVNGEYEFTLEDVEGSVIVVVTADAGSEMVCDAVACGENEDGTIEFGETVLGAQLDGLTLSTIAQIDSSTSSVNSPVNVLTSIAANIVKANPNFANNLDDLTKEVLDILGISTEDQAGVDIFKTQIVSGNNLNSASGITKKLSALNAAFSQVNVNSGDTDLKAKFSTTITAIQNVFSSNSTDKQAALDAAAAFIVAAQQQVAQIAVEAETTVEDDFEAPEYTPEGEGPITSTGTGTGSGSSSGGNN